MGGLSPAHLLIILVVVLLVIGPGKLPETGAAIGHAIREFRRAVDGKDEAPDPAPSSGAPIAATPTPAAPPTTNGVAAAESDETGPA